MASKRYQLCILIAKVVILQRNWCSDGVYCTSTLIWKCHTYTKSLIFAIDLKSTWHSLIYLFCILCKLRYTHSIKIRMFIFHHGFLGMGLSRPFFTLPCTTFSSRCYGTAIQTPLWHSVPLSLRVIGLPYACLWLTPKSHKSNLVFHSVFLQYSSSPVFFCRQN